MSNHEHNPHHCILIGYMDDMHLINFINDVIKVNYTDLYNFIRNNNIDHYILDAMYNNGGTVEIDYFICLPNLYLVALYKLAGFKQYFLMDINYKNKYDNMLFL